METLAVIPARGGSKGVPRKNLALLNGRPLIYYTIQAAQRSKYLTRTILSSDDPEIIAVAQELGLGVPFVRPRELATDQSSSVAVVKHALQFVEQEEGRKYELICVLQPTAPLRSSDDIDTAIGSLAQTNADAVISVTQVEEPHPVKLMNLQNGIITPFLPDRWHERLRRQELEPVYRLNGAIYCVRRSVLLEQDSLWGKKTKGYLMPPERSVNIDSSFDLLVAECLIKQ
jgi:CMP-N-acetylneuraminic acid synthetase